jgi:hypothetical protein
VPFFEIRHSAPARSTPMRSAESLVMAHAFGEDSLFIERPLKNVSFTLTALVNHIVYSR